MVAIDHVGEVTGVLVPKFGSKRGQSVVEDRLPTPGKSRADRKRVQPKRLDLNRFADPRRDLASIDPGVHPSQLLPRFTGREQAVVVCVNVKPSSGRVT